MAKTVDYYKLLGISIFANQTEIRNAYLSKIKQYHPDTYKGNKKEAENVTTELNIAYDTLNDKNKKYVYDVKFGFNKQREEILAQQEKEKRKAEKKAKKQERKKTQVNTADYATEKQKQEQTKKEAEFNKKTEQKEKVKTNFFTKQVKKDTKSVHHKVLSPEEKSTKRERLILDGIIIFLLIVVILLIIFH